MSKQKPRIGQIIQVTGSQVSHTDKGEKFRVFAVHDDVDVWWETAHGENKVALLDALEEYGEEQANKAEWFAEIESVDHPGETMAVASFEVV